MCIQFWSPMSTTVFAICMVPLFTCIYVVRMIFARTDVVRKGKIAKLHKLTGISMGQDGQNTNIGQLS